MGSERARLAASARSCASLRSRLTQTLLQKGGNLSNNYSQQRDLPSALPSLPPPSACPAPSPDPPRAPSASRPAARCRQFRIQSFSTHFVVLFYKRGGEIPVAESRAHTHPPSYPDKSRCTLTSDSSTSSRRELSGAFPATRARRVVLFLLRLRLIYLRPRHCSR